MSNAIQIRKCTIGYFADHVAVKAGPICPSYVPLQDQGSPASEVPRSVEGPDPRHEIDRYIHTYMMEVLEKLLFTRYIYFETI